MKLIKYLALIALLAATAAAQNTVAYGALTASSTNCSVTGSCVVLQLPPNAASASITLTGTFSATVQFEAAGDNSTFAAINAVPMPSGAPVGSATATGQWLLAVGGLTTLRVRVSSYSSGTVTAWLNATPAPFGTAGAVAQVGGTDKNGAQQTLAVSTSGQAQVLNPGFGPSFAAVASTATFTSGATLTLGRTYDIFLTYAGVTGTYTTCTVQPQAQDVAGNVASIGSAQATTPANGTTVVTNLTAAGTAMRFVFACAAYGTAGTLIINPVWH